MKRLFSAGVTLAIIVGVVITWLLIRQPQPQPNKPSQINAATPSTLDPIAAGPNEVSESRGPQAESRPATSSDERSTQPAAGIYQARNVPVVQQTNQLVVNDRVAIGKPQGNTATAGEIDEALSFALEAADPYVKDGFTVREDFWGGALAVKSTKAIVHQLFKGNEYWFWVGTGVNEAMISVHIYDSSGHIAEAEAWAKPHYAAARVKPGTTGSYYLIVEVEKSDRDRTPWALSYGFR